MRLDHPWIAAHIPHQGSMCLLDAVISWDQQQVLCRAGSHRDPDHPLRAYERLGSACAIEYAGQAVAIHGALLQPSKPPHTADAVFGMIASARAVELAVARLDDVPGDLLVSACRLHGDAHSALYAFALEEEREARSSGDRRLLARGRLSLWLDAMAAPSADMVGNNGEHSIP